MFKHILVPLDGSRLAEAALPAACELAAKFDSEITLLRVTSSPMLFTNVDGYVYGDLIGTMRQQSRDEATAYLNSHKGVLRQQGYIVHAQILENESPATAILDVVEVQNMDGIVMSTHGRGGLVRWMFGSVADKVLRHADVPVLLIRANTDEFDVDLPLVESEAAMHEPV
jgi:nucleotide-binding universal stress UspA family protein